MKSKEVVVEKVKEYFNELGLSIKCSTHTWRKDPTRQEPLVFLTESFFINRTHGNRSCELAIAVCKAEGIVEDGYSELQTHINDGQTMLHVGTTGIAGAPLGILANSDNPDEWFFYQYYNPDIYMSDSELKRINRETFERLVIARADWVMLNEVSLVGSLTPIHELANSIANLNLNVKFLIFSQVQNYLLR